MAHLPRADRALVALLLAAQAALYVVTLSLLAIDNWLEPWLDVAALALGYAQWGCTVTWAILAGCRRWISLLLLIPLYGALTFMGRNGVDRGVMLIGLPAVAVFILVAALSIRHVGRYRLMHHSESVAIDNRLRFGIRHVMGLTCLVGLALAAVRRFEWRLSTGPADVVLMFGYVSLPAALLVVGAAWLALASRWRLVVTVLMALVLAMAIAAFLYVPTGIIVTYSAWLVALTVFSLTTFGVLRLAGFRLLSASDVRSRAAPDDAEGLESVDGPEPLAIGTADRGGLT